VCVLGIPAVRYNLQHFLYYFFHEVLLETLGEHPRQHGDQLRLVPPAALLDAEAGRSAAVVPAGRLHITHEFVDFYGITMRGRRD